MITTWTEEVITSREYNAARGSGVIPAEGIKDTAFFESTPSCWSPIVTNAAEDCSGTFELSLIAGNLNATTAAGRRLSGTRGFSKFLALGAF